MADDPATRSAFTPPVARSQPWARVLRGLRVAFDGRKLILGALTLVLLTSGSQAIDRAFGRSPRPPAWELSQGWPGADAAPLEVLKRLAGDVAAPWWVHAAPYRELLTPGLSGQALGHALVSLLWVVLVAAITGGALARIAVLDLAGAGRLGILGALRFAIGRLLALVSAPLSPLVGLAAFGGLGALVGLCYRLPAPVGPTLGGALGFLALLAGLVMALITLGLAVGWPLMTLTIAAEGEDAFDAISRSYSYVYQRPLRCVLSALLAWVAGIGGYLFALGFAQLTIALARWGVAWGGGAAALRAWHGTIPGEPATTEAIAPLPGLWLGLVGLLTAGWLVGYFWSAAAAIYLDLRQDVDGAELEDVYRPEHDRDTFDGQPAPSNPPEPASTPA